MRDRGNQRLIALGVTGVVRFEPGLSVREGEAQVVRSERLDEQVALSIWELPAGRR